MKEHLKIEIAFWKPIGDKNNIQNSVAILSTNKKIFQKANMESVSLITKSKRIKC